MYVCARAYVCVRACVCVSKNELKKCCNNNTFFFFLWCSKFRHLTWRATRTTAHPPQNRGIWMMSRLAVEQSIAVFDVLFGQHGRKRRNQRVVADENHGSERRTNAAYARANVVTAAAAVVTFTSSLTFSDWIISWIIYFQKTINFLLKRHFLLPPWTHWASNSKPFSRSWGRPKMATRRTILVGSDEIARFVAPMPSKTPPTVW